MQILEVGGSIQKLKVSIPTPVLVSDRYLHNRIDTFFSILSLTCSPLHCVKLFIYFRNIKKTSPQTSIYPTFPFRLTLLVSRVWVGACHAVWKMSQPCCVDCHIDFVYSLQHILINKRWPKVLYRQAHLHSRPPPQKTQFHNKWKAERFCFNN